MNFQKIKVENRIKLSNTIAPAQVLRRYAEQSAVPPGSNVRGTKGAGQ